MTLPLLIVNLGTSAQRMAISGDDINGCNGGSGRDGVAARMKSNIPDVHLDAGMDIWTCNQDVNAQT